MTLLALALLAGTATTTGFIAALGLLGTGFRHGLLGFEAGDFLTGNLALDQAFDIRQLPAFIGRHQRNGVAGFPGATGTTDAVDVIFRHVGQIEIHYLGQLGNIQAAGGDVGGHQDGHLAVLEFAQGLGAGALALVGMDGGGADAVFHQVVHQTVGAVLGATEHDRLGPVL